MILERYLAWRFLASLLTVSGVFIGLLLLIDMVEQLRRFAQHPVGLAEAARLSALNLPMVFYRILPLVTLLATVAAFLALARNSELVAMRAAGRSGLRLLVAPVLAAALVGVASVAILNPIVAATSQRYDIVSDRLRGGDGSAVSISREGLWLREAVTEGQRVIRAERAGGDGTRLGVVTVLVFDNERGPLRRIEAEEARLQAGHWALQAVKDWDLTADNPERAAQVRDRLDLPSDLTQARLRDSFGAPASIPIWDLPGFIAQLDEAGFSARQHRVWLQMELALPVLLAAMVLLGASFTMRHARAGRVGGLVLLAIIAGFGVYSLRNLAQLLGDTGQIPVALAAWTTPGAALLLALGHLLYREEA